MNSWDILARIILRCGFYVLFNDRQFIRCRHQKKKMFQIYRKYKLDNAWKLEHVDKFFQILDL